MSNAANSLEKAVQTAVKARSKAHAPYSRFQVGAALKLKGVEDAIPGCNVENASYGGTICAERTAYTQAVARHGKIEPEFLVVVTDEASATVPCAFCLQVIAEFSPDSLPIYLANLKGVQKQYTLKDLLPHPFRSFKASP